MENAKVFEERNVVAICDYVEKYCELYINDNTSFSLEKTKSFHNYFPTLLVHIFGSPTTRGWMQIETQLVQDNAIKSLLSPDGRFFQALLKLSAYSEFSYDLVTERLPADVKKVLSSGATYLLPRVYADCSYLVRQSEASSVDIRAAATRQSTLMPNTVGGDRKIRFNMLQFYLYYFINVPTWPPLVDPTPPTTTLNRQTSTPPYGALRTTPTTANNINTTNTYTNNNTSTPNNTNASISSSIPGNSRPLTNSPYITILDEYFHRFVPISNNDFPPIINSFFFDASVELWIRATWIVSNGKLSSSFMYCITTFIKYIVRHDLRQSLDGESPMLLDIYNVVKDEIYTLISRLALNWRKHDSYLQVIDLWCIWAAPWKLGAAPRSSDKAEYNPMFTGWCPFILDNLPCYFTLVDILLQRISTFLYKESIQPAPNTPVSTYSADGGSINGQLRIIYRLINVIKANGLFFYLSLIETAFSKLSSITANDMIFKQISLPTYGTDTMNNKVHEQLKIVSIILAKLEGAEGMWKPKGLYSKDIIPRADSLLKTLGALDTAILSHTQAQSFNNEKSSKYVVQLQEARKNIALVFKVAGNNHFEIKTTKSETSQGPTQSNNTKSNWIGTTYVGEGGFLTPEEIKAIREGKALCSTDNIPLVGDRAIYFVRSYELSFMVPWTIRMDKKLNDLYDHYLPKEKRPLFFLEKITLRPFARQVNFIYTVATLFLLFYLLIKMIF